MPPEPIPEPEPYVPTLEEVRETKVQEMNALQQAAIQSGVNVTADRWDSGAFHTDRA